MVILNNDLNSSSEQELDWEPTEEPVSDQKLATGLLPAFKWSIDDFNEGYPGLEVEEIPYEATHGRRCSIYEAGQALRDKKLLKPSCYVIDGTATKRLRREIKALGVPDIVKNTDLFTNYWPIEDLSSFLRSRSKLLYTFPVNYQSGPRMTYAGMNEWLKVYSGKIVVTLVKPSPVNLGRFAALEPDQPFVPSQGTTQELILKSSQSFLLIPPGWISFIRAKKNSSVFAGEYLSRRNMRKQLDCFQWNILNNHNIYMTERDTEIRLMYWIYATKLLDNHDNRKILNSYSPDDVMNLKEHLLRWKNLEHSSRKFAGAVNYRPAGLKIELIIKDLQYHISRIGSKKPARKSLQNGKNSSDVLTDQTSTYNHTD